MRTGNSLNDSIIFLIDNLRLLFKIIWLNHVYWHRFSFFIIFYLVLSIQNWLWYSFMLNRFWLRHHNFCFSNLHRCFFDFADMLYSFDRDRFLYFWNSRNLCLFFLKHCFIFNNEIFLKISIFLMKLRLNLCSQCLSRL